MANTGVLPFVRGIDFSNNDFAVSILLTRNYFCLKLLDITDMKLLKNYLLIHLNNSNNAKILVLFLSM